MTRILEHTFAALAAVLIMAATFVPVITAPPTQAIAAAPQVA